MSSLQDTISEATKTAMKARDKERVAVLRLINAEIKRFEVDERTAPTDDNVLDILNRMTKQRKDSITAFNDAGRTELADAEAFEIEIIKDFLPEQLDAAAVEAVVREAIANTGAASMKDMGKVMGAVTGPLKGKADMGAVSALVKQLLG